MQSNRPDQKNSRKKAKLAGWRQTDNVNEMRPVGLERRWLPSLHYRLLLTQSYQPQQYQSLCLAAAAATSATHDISVHRFNFSSSWLLATTYAHFQLSVYTSFGFVIYGSILALQPFSVTAFCF